MTKTQQTCGNSQIRGYSQPIVANDDPLTAARDKLHIALLVMISLGIGIYIIASTVLITQDGVLYIRTAQNFPQDPIGMIKRDPPVGYPFLIFVTHKVMTCFWQGASVYGWIYSAQGISLLSRVLSLLPLYFIGKLLVGPRRSFWGLLFLVLLPYPAEFGSEVVRDWPHILFLSLGLLFLIRGSKFGKWWMFGIAGLAAGLGQTIRAECAQIVIYGILWLLISLFRPRPNISRLKAVCLTLILLIGFAIPALPYMKVRGQVLPLKLKAFINSDTPGRSSGLEQSGFDGTLATYTASGMPIDVLRALGKLTQQISENLLYFFVLPLLVGLYCHYRRLREILLGERFFIFALIVLYLVMMVLLHTNYGYISRRHCMPIIVFTAFYIPVGLRILARWLSERISNDNLAIEKNGRRWLLVLMIVGFAFCAARFARITPLRWDKQGYRDVAQWLKENTNEKVLIVTEDLRIGFYAQRLSGGMDGEKIPRNATYLVKVLDSRQADPSPNFNRKVQKRYSAWMSKKKRGKRIVIYEVF